MEMADFKCLFRMVIEGVKTAFFSFWSIFIDPDTKKVKLFLSFLTEFTIKSSKYALNIQLCMRSCSSNLDRDASKPDFFTYLSFFFLLFSLNEHVSVDFTDNKPYLCYMY